MHPPSAKQKERWAAKLWLQAGLSNRLIFTIHLLCCLWEKHSAGTYKQILRLLVQWDVICTTYKSTESSFPSRHSSQTKNIPQDGQAYRCHPQGIKGTSERKRGSYRLKSGRQTADSYALPRQGQGPRTFQRWEELPLPESDLYNKWLWKWFPCPVLTNYPLS